jgi:hypothetical protein
MLLEAYTSFNNFKDRSEKLKNLEKLHSELLQDYNEYIQNGINGDYNKKLNILLEKEKPMLKDFKKYYIMYNLNPDNSEYQSFFQNIQNNLIELKSELFTLLNNVQTSTNNINKKMIKMDLSIKREKNTNKELKRSIGIIDTKTNTTSQLITNYTEIYNTDYMRNWAIFLSILAIWFITRQIFNNNTNLQNN